MSRRDDLENLLYEQNRLLAESNDLEREKMRKADDARFEAEVKARQEEREAEAQRIKKHRQETYPAQLDQWIKGGRLSFLTHEPRTIGEAQVALQGLSAYWSYFADISGAITPDHQKKYTQARMMLENLSKELSSTMSKEDWEAIKKRPKIEQAKDELKNMQFLQSVEPLFIEDRSRFEMYLKLEAMTFAKRCLYFGVPFLVLMSVLLFVVDPAMIYFKTGKLTIFSMPRLNLTLFGTVVMFLSTEWIFRKVVGGFLFTYKKVYSDKASSLHPQLAKGYPYFSWAQYPDKKHDYSAAMKQIMDKINALEVIKISGSDAISVKSAWKKCESDLADIEDIYKRPINFKAA